MILPLALAVLMGVHFWRIRKDGGLARPADADERLGAGRSADLSGLHRSAGEDLSPGGHRPRPHAAVGRGPENTLPAMPHLFYAELGVFMLTIFICLALSLISDAPLKELANPAVPENPAKAPWYFLGLQELVSYSAFMGGIGIPGIVIIGLLLIPYLDRETEGTGEWFGGPGGLRPGAALHGLRIGRGARGRGLRHPLRLDPRVVARGAAAAHHRRSIRGRC